MPEKLKLGEILVKNSLITEQQLEEALKEQSQKGGYLGQLLINKGWVSSQDINNALQQLSPEFKQWDKLSKMLVIENIVTQEQLEKAVAKSRAVQKPLDEVLVELGYVKQEIIAGALARYLDIPFVKLAEMELDTQTIYLLPEHLVRRHRMVPLRLEGDTLFLAMSDPLNLEALEDVRIACRYKIRQLVATEKDITQVIDQYFNIQRLTKQILSQMHPEQLEAEELLLPGEAEKIRQEPPVTRLVDSIINEGISLRASDIHFEPQYPQMRLRYRVDGILRDITNIPKAVEAAVVSRIKILADMDISEHRRPQDGHISLKLGNKEYDLRVSSFATVAGEKIVIRILDKSSMLLNLSGLGISPDELNIFSSLISRAYGIVLVTGPTGCGKTTTLYAAMNQMDKLSNNIITIEDPVEYKLEGVNQAQVNPLAGITFATGLRSILRQDPDTIMVGEIRDQETAQIAIQAALTGHLVLSTLHTNDAASAVTRLIDMGIEPFLVASSVIGVVAQRLIRTICNDCKEEYTPDEEILKNLGLFAKNKHTFKRGKGCSYCLNTGYRGRTGIYEIMRISENIRNLITQHAPASKIKEAAAKEGMVTLNQAAVQKVTAGFSTPEEIKRVIFSAE